MGCEVNDRLEKTLSEISQAVHDTAQALERE